MDKKGPSNVKANADNDTRKPPDEKKDEQNVVKKEESAEERPLEAPKGKGTLGKSAWEKKCQDRWGGDMDKAYREQQLLLDSHKKPEGVVMKQEEPDDETEPRN